ncbi:MATE family efflux transporter [Bifidobacterium callitrichidarum]|uniref:MATE family efflux transporter n=1 Tax=Bifidobacterium callitrichidarum TaxID=2052941 RepID=A0A2U2N2Z7_9BIFI|nr:MATE family efflux transporter [Bifidobacterium callitrichidarum]PWG63437.1 MATE family efflux transporter [Bifidobacterium callitrichidarum]
MMAGELTFHDFTRQLRPLALPIAFQQFVLVLSNAFDVFMLAAVDQNALSAVSLATQFQFIFDLFLMAFTIGTSTLIAQYWGRGDVGAVQQVITFVMRHTIALSAIFAILAATVPHLLMRITTNDAVLIDLGSHYLSVTSLAFMLIGVSQINLCLFKNTGRARTGTAISAAGVALHIVVSATLLFGLLGMPRLGVTGVAISTVVSRTVECVWSCWKVRRDSRRHNAPGVQWRTMLPIPAQCKTDAKTAGTNRIAGPKAGPADGSAGIIPGNAIRLAMSVLERDYWRYTLPVLGNEIIWGGGFATYTIIMGHLGTDAVAANSVANIIKDLLVCLCAGLGSGGGILLGSIMGCGDLAQARHVGRWLCCSALALGVAIGAVILMIRPLVLHWSSLDARANEYLSGMLLVCAYYVIGKALNSITVGGIFPAGGDSRFGMVCDAVTIWAIVIPLGMLAAFVWQLPVMVVYVILNIDEMLKIPAVVAHYRTYRWLRNVTRESD